MGERMRLEPVVEVSAGGWIGERLAGPVGTVGSVVPRGFAGYARVLHPIEYGGEPVGRTWAQVCRHTGRIPHASMQWTAISTPAAENDEPRRGHLEPGTLGALIDVLAPGTGDQDCFHALWEGWGWVDGGGLPRLSLPYRDYLLFRGPLPAALELGDRITPDWFEPQSPSLLWPADRSWCVATEIDFDSTLVGGPEDLIGAVLAAAGLESWPIEPDADLTITGDRLNR